MTERKVDVMDKTGKLLRTYPVTIGEPSISPEDADYERAPLNAARTAKLVPELHFASLKTRMHTAA